MQVVNNTEIKILETPLSVDDCYRFVTTHNCGGIDIFVGTVRDTTQGKKVVSLDFEAYVPMAISEMGKIALKLQERWKIQRICIHHRTGLLDIGEIAVIIAVAAPHRGDAFDACRFAIDTLKETVPIWKKEIFEDGAVWVSAHP